MNKSTVHAKKLFEALKKKNIVCEIEKWDKHKHIDLSIDKSRIYIEVDGDHHYTNPTQIKRDLFRDFCSTSEGFRTIRIPNRLIDDKLNEVASAITKVAKDCIKNKKPTNK